MNDEIFQERPGEILIVDDLSENLLTLTTLLKDEGFKVRIAQSGVQAIRSVKTKLPDLILLDIRMPEMDGYEVCQRLKHDVGSREIPIIFVSAMDDTTNKVKAFKIGGVDYLTKPFHSEEVVARVNTHLQLRQLQKQLKKYSQTLENRVDKQINQLKKSREDYSRLVENLNVGIFRSTLDHEGRFLMVNQALVNMLDFENHDRLLTQSLVCLYQNAADRQSLLAILLKNGFVRNQEVKLRSKTGRLLTASISAQLLRDKDGQPLYYDGIVEDITEKIKLESRLRQAQKMESIGTLAGGIAHDFNNILTVLMGYGDMVLGKLPEGSEIWQHQKQTVLAGNRAKELVKQILAFSRQEVHELHPIQPYMAVREVLTFLRATIPATIEIQENIQETGLVLADSTQLHQIVMNLCTNADHAMRENGGILSISVTPIECNKEDVKVISFELPPGKFIKIEVSDTGHGMSEDIMERIFEPYFTTKKKEEGTGLGLAAVHGIVKSYGGHVAVDSEVGRGTTFNVYLPQVVDEKDARKKEAIIPLPRGTERLLVVDDQKGIAIILEKMLKSLGYQVRVFTNSKEALESFKQNPDHYDLIITDMTMPRLTGVELSQRILAIRGDMPIILATGFSVLITEKKAKAMGIRKYMMKPLIEKDVAFSVREVLDNLECVNNNL